jgi:anti-sigma-K factor RskA
MSGCPDYNPLLGGYILGALEPAEMEEMRRHLAACPHCGPEADRLAALPGLLDRIQPADVPPPALSPQVEEAVLDRFARERREARRPRRLRLRRRPVVALAGAGAAALVAALAIAWPLGGDDGDPAYASVALSPVAEARNVAASAVLDSVPAGTRIRLEARGLPTGAEYEVWCIRVDGRWVSGGTFWPDRDGVTEAELTAAVRAGNYHKMVVTKRPAKGGEGDRGPSVLRGTLRY